MDKKVSAMQRRTAVSLRPNREGIIPKKASTPYPHLPFIPIQPKSLRQPFEHKA